MSQNGRDCHLRCVKLFSLRAAADSFPVRTGQDALPLLARPTERGSETAEGGDENEGVGREQGKPNGRKQKFVFALKSNNQQVIR